MPTTDDVDRITKQERRSLVGYCDICDTWTPFIDGFDERACEGCHGPFSQKHGTQITTQRTFSLAKLKKKLKQKRTHA